MTENARLLTLLAFAAIATGAAVLIGLTAADNYNTDPPGHNTTTSQTTTSRPQPDIDPTTTITSTTTG